MTRKDGHCDDAKDDDCGALGMVRKACKAECQPIRGLVGNPAVKRDKQDQHSTMRYLGMAVASKP